MTKLLDFTPPIKCSYREGVANPALKDAAARDALKFKAKLVSGRGGHKTIEIRKRYNRVDASNILIVVSDDGWDMGQHESRTAVGNRNTRGLNVRLSMNNPARMTFDELSDIHAVVAEAAGVLGL